MNKLSQIFKSGVAPAVLSNALARDNTLTGLIGSLYAGMDVVSRELVGFIPSVTRNVSAERAALGQVVTYPVSPAMPAADVVPAMVVPEPNNRTVGTGGITITKSRQVNFGFVGEEVRGLNNGAGFNTIQADFFAQALRTLTNEMEADLALEAANNASRAFGTVNTIPFTTNTAESAQMKKILDDNGAPMSERSLIVDTTVGAQIRTLTQLNKVNEAGTAMTLRDGELLNLAGFSVKESAGIVRPVAGTAANATTDNAGYAIGARTITLASAGTGAFVAGDYVTFAGDSNKYLLTAGDADVSGGGTIVLAEPGLRQAIPASTTAITLIARSYRNIGFTRSALHLVARAPALPNGRDSAVENIMLTDPRSGMSFEVRLYEGYRKMRAEVACAWGVKAVAPRHIAALIY